MIWLQKRRGSSGVVVVSVCCLFVFVNEMQSLPFVDTVDPNAILTTDLPSLHHGQDDDDDDDGLLDDKESSVWALLSQDDGEEKEKRYCLFIVAFGIVLLVMELQRGVLLCCHRVQTTQ
jgi:hypothetical protein